MYNEYFGFRGKPFNVTPDPRLFYANRSYEEAYSSLLYGIRERKGFLLLTGEVGTGKTTILQKLMEELEPAVSFVFFYNTTLTFEELLTFICDELGLTVQGSGRLSKISALNAFLLGQLSKGSTAALFVDEAQNLAEDVFENLRLLSNLETRREKLLQIVLAGQPELEVKLDRRDLRQVKQRIFSHSRLESLNDAEVGAFIDYRLKAVGYAGKDLFARAAVGEIARYSNGTPRLINIICDNALLIAYADSRKQVGVDIIGEVARDLHLEGKSQVPSVKAEISPIFSKQRKERNGHHKESSQRESSEPAKALSYVTAPAPERPLPAPGRSPADSETENVSRDFLDHLTRELTEAMGPMARLVISERLALFGNSAALPKGTIDKLVTSVSSEILDNVLRARFQTKMAGLVRSLNGNGGKINA